MYVTVAGNDSMRHLGAVLSRAGDGELRKAVRAGVVQAAKPIQRAAQANARAIPHTSTRQSPYGSLGDNIARAITVRVLLSSRNAVARIEVRADRMPPGQQSLPYIVEGRVRGRWRKPVFPRPGTPRDQWTWAEQPIHPYLEPAADSHGAAAYAEIDRTISTTIAAIERA